MRETGPRPGLQLVLLHALPLDGSMWAAQMELLPGATHAPDLYGLGERVEDWAAAVLERVAGDRLLVVGCSVGGSCALEMAAFAPHRIEALVLVGTKAAHRPDPALEAAVVGALGEHGIAEAWDRYWAPMFSPAADRRVLDEARRIALRRSAEEIARGVAAFHRRPGREDMLPRLGCPVVVVSGADDRAPGPAVSAAQAALAPRGRLHVVPACGHYVPMERPEALNAILGDLIAILR